jgi:hypothetical protein
MTRQSSEQLERSDRLTITFGKGQRGKIEAIAKKRRTSAATVIRWALDEYIAAHTKGGAAATKREHAHAP